MAYRKSSIKPPYLLSSSFEGGDEGGGGLIETRNLFGGGRGLFNLEKTMVSILHKELEYKVPRFFVSNNQFCYIAGNVLPTARALIRGHMTSNNKTVSRRNLWAGNIAKSMTSEGNSALLPANVDRRSQLQLGLMNFQLYNKPLSLGKQSICFPRIPVIFEVELWETLRFWKTNLTVSLATSH